MRNKIKKRRPTQKAKNLKASSGKLSPRQTDSFYHVKRDDLEKMVQERTAELRTHQIELEVQNEELRIAQRDLETSRRKYAELYEFAPVGYLMLDANGLILETNLTAANQLGFVKQRLVNRLFSLFIPEREDRLLFSEHKKEIFATRQRQTCEIKLKRNDGAIFFARLESVADEEIDSKARQMRTAIADITERKRAEDVLKRFSEELQAKVKEKTRDLADANTALKVLLKHREQDREELEERIVANVRDLAIPCIEQLRKNGTGHKREIYLDLLESGLSAVISPFLGRLSKKHPDVTGTELQVITFIKAGKGTKEIAELLGVSTGTVDFHRNNIRTKLGLKRTKTNLRTYLLSLK